MGLSNEERYEKILFSISHIDDLMTDMNGYTTKKLKSLANQLWYAFLKKESNGLMWIMGSDLASNHLHSGLLSAAFEQHIPNQQETLEEMDAELRKKDKFYDSYKVLSSFFDMDRLLEREKRAVLMTYHATQAIAYALCRYRDKFLKSYKDLNFLLRKMQGECFKIMKADREYAYAWMLHHLCDMIYTSDEKDIVNQWWTKHCISHSVKLRYEKYAEIFEAFKKYQFKKPTLHERIELTFLVMAEKYAAYEHQHKEFLSMVGEYNKVKKNKIKINEYLIEEAFTKAKAMKQKEQTSYSRDTHCEFTGNYVDHKGEVHNRWGS